MKTPMGDAPDPADVADPADVVDVDAMFDRDYAQEWCDRERESLRAAAVVEPVEPEPVRPPVDLSSIDASDALKIVAAEIERLKGLPGSRCGRVQFGERLGIPCPECGAGMIYKDSRYGGFWGCERYPNCDGTCSAHKATGFPQGLPAAALTKQARRATHAAFDRLWVSRVMERQDAYRWLAIRLNLSIDECHIGLFSIRQCSLAVQAVNRFMEQEAERRRERTRNKNRRKTQRRKESRRARAAERAADPIRTFRAGLIDDDQE